MRISSRLLAGVALLSGQMLLGAMVVTLTTGTALAAAHNPLIVWQGGATLTSLSAACILVRDELGVGGFGTSIYRPRLDPAEPPSAISMIGHRSAVIYQRTSGGGDQMHGSGNYIGVGMSTRAEGATNSFTGTYTFTITPSTITETTNNIQIVGTIRDFGDEAGCTVKFRASYQRRPN